MPVFSYLAYPTRGNKEHLFRELSKLEYCEVVPADREEVLVLLTDTPDEMREKELQEQLAKIKYIQALTLTFGHGDA